MFYWQRCQTLPLVCAHGFTGSTACSPASASFLVELVLTPLQDFAEKPKGEALKAMQVDTTALGLDAERYVLVCGDPDIIVYTSAYTRQNNSFL